MKFSASREVLLKPLQAVIGVVERRQTTDDSIPGPRREANRPRSPPAGLPRVHVALAADALRNADTALASSEIARAAEQNPTDTYVDLVAGEGLDSPAVINLGRLLQSLDAVPGDDRITIPAVVRDRALATNPALTGVIEHLDYADETRFVNAASQLLAVLTDGYPHTVVLVDASQARLHLERALSRAGVPVGNR